MSKTFWDRSGKKLEYTIVEDRNRCMWLCDEVCCNDKSEFLADYPTCNCDKEDNCGLFEEEE